MPAQHILGGLKALEEREQRGCWGSGRAWRFGGPMRSITHGLSSVPAATYMFVESSDWSSSPSGIVAAANQPKICCAHHSAIGIAAVLIGRVQHASSQMSFPLWNHTQHSSERTIGHDMLRATYGDASIAPIAGGGRLVRHVSDHADEIDGTIASTSRGVDARAIAKATLRSSQTSYVDFDSMSPLSSMSRRLF